MVKLDYLPEVRIPAGEKDFLIPIRTPDLGMLQFFFLKAKTYRKYRKMISEFDEELEYRVIIKAPHVRLEKRSGTPTCYLCDINFSSRRRKSLIK